jgi:hypothetical protein
MTPFFMSFLFRNSLGIVSYFNRKFFFHSANNPPKIKIVEDLGRNCQGIPSSRQPGVNRSVSVTFGSKKRYEDKAGNRKITKENFVYNTIRTDLP